ncbi:radical SAM/SPASM domain-containing protein [Desulfoluna butyratoxydans]|uniref:Radical sam n=1 Tax=Desulfoluna butyratoxydans TaxID=231438 RepID=A0A4U8YRI2_9BACT|nr:radical SAM protein [Desulfoluna butyratoxydans]VFQ45929.1 radical sam [Desulfoluna butyratoxydans]
MAAAPDPEPTYEKDRSMDYLPVTAVWEITMGCNMRCDHCGSSCAEPLPDELTTDEALALCDDLKEVGLKWITLSGGEPLTRTDWPKLAGRLTANGIKPNIITNGWLVNEEMVKTAQANGVETISISLDGNRETHDAIRKKGAFDKVISAFQVLNACNHVSASNTTVTKHNLHQLDEIKEILLENNVDLWQIQIGLPMGNMAEDRESVVEPSVIEYLIDYSHQVTMEGRIKVFPADCLGYYTEKESIVRQISMNVPTAVLWQGCNAGKRSFGILHNGDILGCTSIRDTGMIEGNIRERPLTEIWNAPDAFSWSRSLKKSDLGGLCGECAYGDACLGGCPNTRLTLNGSIHAENQYCVYHTTMEATRSKLKGYNDPAELMETAWAYANQQKWQLSSLTLKRVLELDPQRVDALELFGFVSYNLNNFTQAKEANEEVLKMDPQNPYALKGLGLSLHRLNRTEEGIASLLKATEAATPQHMDSFYDLSVVYSELNQPGKAREILEEGEKRFPGYIGRFTGAVQGVYPAT